MADVILGWEGSEPKVSGVLQAVLLFGSETWILNPRMELYLGSFQHRVGRQIKRKQPRRRGEGGWDYPPLASGMEEAVFEDIGVFIQNRQNMVAQYILM